MIIEIRDQLYKIEFSYWDRSVRASIQLIQSDVLDDKGRPKLSEVAGAIAKCSERDQINWRVGRKKALARALPQMDWTYEERTDFWSQLFDETYGINRE